MSFRHLVHSIVCKLFRYPAVAPCIRLRIASSESLCQPSHTQILGDADAAAGREGGGVGDVADERSLLTIKK